MTMRKMMLTSLSLFLGLTLMATAAMARGPGLSRGFGMRQEFGCPDPKGKSIDVFRQVRDLIENKVTALLREID